MEIDSSSFQGLLATLVVCCGCRNHIENIFRKKRTLRSSISREHTVEHMERNSLLLYKNHPFE